MTIFNKCIYIIFGPHLTKRTEAPQIHSDRILTAICQNDGHILWAIPPKLAPVPENTVFVFFAHIIEQFSF